MKIWLNNKLNRAIWNGLNQAISDEFEKWNGYPHTQYGDDYITGEACKEYWNNVFWAMRRQWGYSCYTQKLYNFKWSDIL